MSLASRCRPSSPLALLVLFALLVCCLLPTLASSQPTAQLPTITSVSGCTDVGTATFNCSLAGEVLTIYGTNFLLNETSAAAVGVLFAPQLADCWVHYPIAATSLTCSLHSERLPLSVNGLESVQLVFPSLVEAGQSYYTPSFAGVMFIQQPFATLTSISGCDDSNNSDGQYTAKCQPDTDIITLRGSNFKALNFFVDMEQDSRVVLTIGGVGHSTAWTLVDDSTITISLAESYSRVVVPDHYSGAPLDLTLSIHSTFTNSVKISFVVPIPPPQVSALTSDGTHPTIPACRTSTTSPMTLGGCWPGRSVLIITGHYFYPPLTVYIGGKECNQTGLGATGRTITCLVPLLDHYVPGLYYDLTINDTVYADEPEIGVLPAAISFIPGPILSSVVPCIDTLAADNAVTPKCQPGQDLTMIGTDFLPIDPAAYLTLTGVERDFSANCTALLILDDEHLVCTLPDFGSIAQWTPVSFTLYANGNTSATLSLWPYEANSPFNVTGMSGCASGTSSVVNGIPTLTGCYPGEKVDIHGYNFEGPDIIAFTIHSTNVPTADLSVGYTSAVLISTLLPSASAILFDTPLYFNVRDLDSTSASVSNPFAIVFSRPTAPATSSTGVSSSSSSSSAGSRSASSSTGGGSDSGSGSSGLSNGAVAGVVVAVIVGVLFIAAAMVALCRRHGSKASMFQAHSDDSDGSGSARTDHTYDTASVELHERS